jgi:hypothetical protein
MVSDYDHGAANVSNVAGAALWALDYSFYASTPGIERLHYHEGVGFKYNFLSTIRFMAKSRKPIVINRFNQLRYTTHLKTTLCLIPPLTTTCTSRIEVPS